MKKTSFPGNELREQREKLGMSVYEAFRRTRVPAQYITALERADLQALPTACYAVGFLKTYCEFLGLNPDRYVDSLQACLRPSAIRFLRNEDGAKRRPPAWLEDAMTWAIVTAIVVLGWVTYSVVFKPQTDTIDKRVDAGTIELAPPTFSVESPRR